MKKTLIAGAVGALFCAATAQAAAPSAEQIRAAVEGKVKTWVAQTAVIDSVRAQNEQTAALSEAEIVELDQQWRAETGASDRPLIDKTLANPLSAYLQKVKGEGGGLFTEIFVMDGKGLNVGQSDVTSDYWQGDEDKWQKTFLAGAGAVHVSEVEFDESSQTYQSQFSMPIVDPATSTVIGAVTVGVDVTMVGN